MKIKLTDYKIRSKGIYLYVVFSFNLLLLSLVGLEWLINIASTDLELIGSFFACALLMSAVSYRWQNNVFIKHAFISSILVYVEINYYFNPHTFHLMIFWLPIVSTAALLVLGIRAGFFWLGISVAAHILNFILFKKFIGESYDFIVFRHTYFMVGFIFIFMIFFAVYLLYQFLGQAFEKIRKRNRQLKELKLSIELKKGQLEKYHQTLVRLYKDESFHEGGRLNLYSELTKTASTVLGVNRVSIWLFENNNAEIKCQYLFESGNESAEKIKLKRQEEMKLARLDFPQYFHALEKKPFIIAIDAYSHPDTYEFKHSSYLHRNQIFSMLDCPILIDGKPIGVICCENKFNYIEWNIEDAIFVQSLADFVAMQFKNEKIKELYIEVSQQNEELLEYSHEIVAMNEELNLVNKKLTTMNETLEDAVLRRTEKLEKQNEQLTEYAFINSHQLRAPIARILGLSNLLKMDMSLYGDQQMIDSIHTSTNELDAIVQKINDVLHEGNHLTRHDINEMLRNKNRNRAKLSL